MISPAEARLLISVLKDDPPISPIFILYGLEVHRVPLPLIHFFAGPIIIPILHRRGEQEIPPWLKRAIRADRLAMLVAMEKRGNVSERMDTLAGVMAYLLLTSDKALKEQGWLGIYGYVAYRVMSRHGATRRSRGVQHYKRYRLNPQEARVLCQLRQELWRVTVRRARQLELASPNYIFQEEVIGYDCSYF